MTENKKKLESYTLYTIHLLKSVIENQTPQPLPHELDVKELIEFSHIHKIECLIYAALSQLSLPESCREEMTKLKGYYYSTVMQSTQQQYMLNLLESKFEEKGILHMPLKGSVLKFLYPDPLFRASTDIDMFIGKGNGAAAKEVMDELGFTTDHYDTEVLIHDTYSYGKTIYVELHHELMPHIPYFKGVEVCPFIENSIVPDGGKYKYRMTHEGFYAFMMIHIAKHVKHNGMGIRGFLDVWVYLNHYKDVLDFSEINRLMKESHLEQFHQSVIDLVDYWFNNKTHVPDYIKDFAHHVAQGGILGTREQVISEELYKNRAEGKKFRYYIETIFLPLQFMRDKYKILRKWSVLLPFCWIHRIITILLFKQKSIGSFKNHFEKADVKQGEHTANLKKKLGL